MFIHERGEVGSPAIVFLHGNGANGSMWKKHMALLSEYHCLAPDFPGFGQSGNQEWDSLCATTDEIIQLIKQRTPRPKVHIVGLSLGGSVALTWLGTAPHYVDHAIVDGAGVQIMPGLPLMKLGFRLMQPFMHREFFIRAIARMTKIPVEDYEEFRQGMLSMSPSSFRRAFLQASSMGFPPGLEKAENPVLLVAGENEPKVVKESQTYLAGLLPNAVNYVAPHMGHGWLAEAPELHCRMVQA